MSQLFSSKVQGPSEATQKAQRRQAERANKQVAEEAREAGGRRRALQAGRRGGGLFSQTGARGVQNTLG